MRLAVWKLIFFYLTHRKLNFKCCNQSKWSEFEKNVEVSQHEANVMDETQEAKWLLALILINSLSWARFYTWWETLWQIFCSFVFYRHRLKFNNKETGWLRVFMSATYRLPLLSVCSGMLRKRRHPFSALTVGYLFVSKCFPHSYHHHTYWLSLNKKVVQEKVSVDLIVI